MRHRLNERQRAILHALMPTPRAVTINPSRDRRSLEMRGLIEETQSEHGTRMWTITEAGMRAVRGAEIADKL